MIFSSPIMIMQISIPKLVIEIARTGNNQCLKAGEKHRERERERVKKQKNGPKAHPQQKKRNIVQLDQRYKQFQV